MKKTILAATMLAALSAAHVSAMAYENLPEAQVGNGMGPESTAPSTGPELFQQPFDAPDEVDADNDPEANVGDGSR